MSEQRPKIQFDANVPVTFTAKFASPGKAGENEGRAWFLWTVEKDGEDHSMFADEALNEALIDLAPARGSQVTVTRNRRGKEPYYWTVESGKVKTNTFSGDAAAAAPSAKPANGRQAAQEAPRRESAPAAAPERTAPSAPALDDLVALMDACWRKAAEIAGSLPEDLVSADTVQAVGVSLFIEARRHRIDAPPADEPRELADNEVQHPAQAARERIAQQKRVARAFDAEDEDVPLPEPGPEAATDDLPF